MSTKYIIKSELSFLPNRVMMLTWNSGATSRDAQETKSLLKKSYRWKKVLEVFDSRNL